MNLIINNKKILKTTEVSKLHILKRCAKYWYIADTNAESYIYFLQF